MIEDISRIVFEIESAADRSEMNKHNAAEIIANAADEARAGLEELADWVRMDFSAEQARALFRAAETVAVATNSRELRHAARAAQI